MEITSLEQLKIIAEGDVIELPRFNDDIPFIVKVKRVSLLGLLRKGVIPNTLLSAAEELFYGKKSSKGVDMDQVTNVMFVMAENTLIEPSIKDLTSVGLELTDEQLVALFNYSQKGLKAVQKFRTESEDNVSVENVETLQSKAEPNNKSN